MDTRAKICPKCRNEYPASAEYCICGGKLVRKDAVKDLMDEIFEPFRKAGLDVPER